MGIWMRIREIRKWIEKEGRMAEGEDMEMEVKTEKYRQKRKKDAT